MRFSRHETFFWLKHAQRLGQICRRAEHLDRALEKKFMAGETPPELLDKLKLADKKHASEKEIQDYCEVQRSFDRARTILIALATHEVSIDELDRRKNETSGITYDWDNGFRMSVKKSALARIAATGSTSESGFAMSAGIITKADVKRAKKRKPHPLFEPERVSIVARFLIDNWRGHTVCYGMWLDYFETKDQKLSNMVGVATASSGDYVCKKSPSFFFMPPLCFFSNDALATFCALTLGKKQSDPDTSAPAVRKWVSRLRLKRAACPKIREVKIVGDEIHFLR
jgi:hypothetical protein